MVQPAYGSAVGIRGAAPPERKSSPPPHRPLARPTESPHERLRWLHSLRAAGASRARAMAHGNETPGCDKIAGQWPLMLRSEERRVGKAGGSRDVNSTSK